MTHNSTVPRYAQSKYTLSVGGPQNERIQESVGSYYSQRKIMRPTRMVCCPGGSVVERPLRERVVVGSNPDRAIPKALKMVPVATLLGAQHYKASTGSPLTQY